MATNDEPIEDQNHLAEGETISEQADEQVNQNDEKKEETVESATGSLNNNAEEDDDDLEEGELKDDDDDDDDDNDNDDDEENDDGGLDDSKRLTGYNTNNNNDNNISGFSKESSYNDKRNDQHQQALHQQQNYPSHHGSSGQPPHHSYHNHPNRHLSPNSQHLAEMHSQYPTNHHHFSSNSSNNNHYRYPPNDGPPHLMNHHPQAGPPAAMFPRGGTGSGGNIGPMHKGNMRCRFYSKTSNKCTWGDHCRFEHRDDSPGHEFDNRPPFAPGRGPPPPMGAAERGQYPPYSGRHQPYGPPPLPPHGYPYEHYGYHHSTPPPQPHQMSHWRQQHSPYPSSSLGHPPESVSPALLPTPGGGGQLGTSNSSTSGRGPPPPPPGSSGGSGSSGGGTTVPIGGAPSPGYPSPSSSAVVYERKHRLAYEVAPWNDRNYPPPSKYDRGDPVGAYPNSRGFYRNHYSREPHYGREPMPHMGGVPHSGGYPNYPSAYRGGSMGPHASHFKSTGSSQRTVLPDTRRSRSNKRGHDEDESSWSDSGSDDSILNPLSQANYSSKSRPSKISKQPPDNMTSDEPLDQGTGTPPGEPSPEVRLRISPEERERQEMLLNKLEEIEVLMAKKKKEAEQEEAEQEDLM